MATIRWTLRARLDVQDIRNFLARSSIQNAGAFEQSILDAVRRLEDFPRVGRIVPEFDREDLREILVPPYRVLYLTLKDEVVEVQAIYHSSRDLRRVLGNNPLN